jgi:hypothetical protein
LRPQTEILVDRVRKVAHEGSGTIQTFLLHLQSTGIDYIPTPLSLSDRLEEISYLPGVCYGAVEPRPNEAWDIERLEHLGRAVRRCHDSSVEFLSSWRGAQWFPFAEPCAAPEVICHNDLGPWNVPVDGEHIHIIDWEMAAPGMRIWDVAHIAWNWVPYFPPAERARVSFPEPYQPEARLAALLKGYGASHWTAREVLEEVLQRQSRTLELAALSISTEAMLLENWENVETDPILADQAFVRECIGNTA